MSKHKSSPRLSSGVRSKAFVLMQAGCSVCDQAAGRKRQSGELDSALHVQIVRTLIIRIHQFSDCCHYDSKIIITLISKLRWMGYLFTQGQG